MKPKPDPAISPALADTFRREVSIAADRAVAEALAMQPCAGAVMGPASPLAALFLVGPDAPRLVRMLLEVVHDVRGNPIRDDSHLVRVVEDAPENRNN